MNCGRIFVACFVLGATACSGSSIEHTLVLVGSKGPQEPSVQYLGTTEAVEGSWLKSSLSTAELAQVLSRVNFQHQAIVAVAVGERTNATGNVSISRIRRLGSADHPVLDVSVQVGTAQSECRPSIEHQRLFLLASIERLPGDHPNGVGFDLANFPDQCAKGG
jgi:hypothetical protein